MDDVFFILVVYVDDMLLTGPNEAHIAEFKAELNAAFEMSDLGHCITIWGFNFCNVMEVLLCVRQSM